MPAVSAICACNYSPNITLQRIRRFWVDCRVSWDHLSFARQNDAARAMDAAACIDTSIGLSGVKSAKRK
jgi:hypothetical protein